VHSIIISNFLRTLFHLVRLSLLKPPIHKTAYVVLATKSNVASTLLLVWTGFNKLASAKAIALIVRSNYIQDVFITRATLI